MKRKPPKTKVVVPEKPNLYVKEIATGEIVLTKPVRVPTTWNAVDRLVRGMMINMDLDKYTVDDDEASLWLRHHVGKP